LITWLVSQIVPANPAAPVKGPTHVVKRGKTPVLSVEDARTLLDSISLDSLQGLRDRALIGVMLFSFARVSAVLGMKVSDFYENGRRRWFRLLEKGGKHHEVPVHHKAQDYVAEYLEKAGFEPNKPLFQTFNKKQPTGRPMSRSEAYRMMPASSCCRHICSGVLPFVSGDRDHCLPRKQRNARNGSEDRGA
jgi:site-specific recombinase XerC